MQHKQRHSRVGILLLALLAAVVGTLVTLLAKDIPAPQQPVEKQLDAKNFIEPKT